MLSKMLSIIIFKWKTFKISQSHHLKFVCSDRMHHDIISNINFVFFIIYAERYDIFMIFLLLCKIFYSRMRSLDNITDQF